jgi:hypothetical protein
MIDHNAFSFVDLDGAPTIGLWFEAGCALFRPGDRVLFAEDAAAAETSPLGWRMSDREAANVAEALEIATALAVQEKADRAAREKSLQERKVREGAFAAADPDESNRPNAYARARAWMRAQPPSLGGEGGEGYRRLWIVALGIVRGFRIVSDYAAIVLLEEYNTRAEPKWPIAQLQRVIANVKTHGRMPWGELLDRVSLPKPGGGSGGRGST